MSDLHALSAMCVWSSQTHCTPLFGSHLFNFLDCKIRLGMMTLCLHIDVLLPHRVVHEQDWIGWSLRPPPWEALRSTGNCDKLCTLRFSYILAHHFGAALSVSSEHVVFLLAWALTSHRAALTFILVPFLCGLYFYCIFKTMHWGTKKKSSPNVH